MAESRCAATPFRRCNGVQLAVGGRKSRHVRRPGAPFPRPAPVVVGLQAEFPGLRPVLFHSPYEAAVWTVIGNRIRRTQAARIKARLAERYGEPVEVAGRTLHAFPHRPSCAGCRINSPRSPMPGVRTAVGSAFCCAPGPRTGRDGTGRSLVHRSPNGS
ncbi:hypothetical protein [Streptomyces sp. NPDC087294]|uniref:hypothetical protein n=1 Tax=Streptomyces sp. NPDC087294 TaxID=3365777 RepID=UPI0037F6357A